MDSFELNKILGALTGMFGIYLAISIVTEGMYSNGHHGEEQHLAYALDVGDGGHDGGNHGGEPAEPAIETVLAAVDPASGARVFKKCVSCHNLESGAAAKTGPNLWGIVGADIAAAGGFAYSGDLASKGGAWDWEALSAFLKKPKDFAPGTKMSFSGLKKVEDRAALIAYLNENSDAPLPLPEAATN